MMMNFVFNLVVIFILGSLDESHVLGSGTAPTDDGVSVWLPVNDLLGNIARFGAKQNSSGFEGIRKQVKWRHFVFSHNIKGKGQF